MIGGGGNAAKDGTGNGGGKGAGRGRAARPAFKRLAPPAHPTPHTVRVPILTYHRVHQYATELTKSQPDETVEPSTFRAEM